jgi:hypothetical protein
MAYDDIPDELEVKQAHDRLAAAKARVKVALYVVEDFEARMDKAKPRTPWARKLGVDEVSERESKAIRKELLDAERDLIDAESVIAYMLFHKDVYKAKAYRERL